MAEFSMPDKLWDLANLITSFAVVQTAATAIAVTKGDLKALELLFTRVMAGAIWAHWHDEVRKMKVSKTT